MPVIEKKVYITTDEAQFDTRAEANAHESEIGVLRIISDIYREVGEPCTDEAILAQLELNAAVIIKYLKPFTNKNKL